MRDLDREHVEMLKRNRVRCPRAAKLADALFDMAHDHSIEALETLAIEVDGSFVQRGIEITEQEWGRAFRAAVDVLNRRAA